MGKIAVNNEKKKLVFNLILFSLNIVYIFFLAIFFHGETLSYLYGVVLSIIFILTVFSIKGKGNFYTYFVVVTILILWLAQFYDRKILGQISGVITILFFISAIVNLIKRISRSAKVTPLVFIEAINIFFLLGIIGSVLFKFVYNIDPASFTRPVDGNMAAFDFIYYSFVTLTTLGYGDISPVHPLARSFAIMLSVTGQLYLTMIIAMLVGKYIGGLENNEE
jgi:hypothetical protein